MIFQHHRCLASPRSGAYALCGRQCQQTTVSWLIDGLMPVIFGLNVTSGLLHVQAAFLTWAMGGSDRYDGNSNMTTAHERLVSGPR